MTTDREELPQTARDAAAADRALDSLRGMIGPPLPDLDDAQREAEWARRVEHARTLTSRPVDAAGGLIPLERFHALAAAAGGRPGYDREAELLARLVVEAPRE